METKHTPGPLKTDGNGIITGGPDYCTSICTTPVILWRTAGVGKNDQIMKAQANARRLVACWNILEGISTKDIEQGTTIQSDTDKIFIRLAAESTRLQELNAELLKVCKATDKYFRACAKALEDGCAETTDDGTLCVTGAELDALADIAGSLVKAVVAKAEKG